MRKIERLRQEARIAATWRGHTMSRFVPVTFASGEQVFRSVCIICGKMVDVSLNPPPNGIEIGGRAVALQCED